MKLAVRKKIVWFVFFILTIFILIRAYYHLTDDFRVSNIHHPLPKEVSWNIEELSGEQKLHINEILQKKFYYLGKGAQSYAFESEDHLYVLKFFKFKHLRPSFFVDLLPSIGPLKKYKEKQEARKKRKLFGVFNAYRLAFEVDREDSGLIDIQLNTEDNQQRFVTIVDKIGLKRKIELTNIPFILQKKGTTLRDVLNSLLKSGHINLSSFRIGQIFDMYEREYQKGIYDHDHGVMQNSGFIGDKPIHLDVGKLVKDDKMQDKAYAKEDELLVAAKIKAWIKLNFPSNYEVLSKYIDERVK